MVTSICCLGTIKGHEKVQAKKGRHPFEQSNFIERGKKVDSFDKLILVNIRTIKIMFEHGEDIRGLIDHVEMLCKKAGSKVFQIRALCDYDEAVRARADTKWMSAFERVEAGDILKYFLHDSSLNAMSSRSSKSKTKTDNSARVCFAFNKSDVTCAVVCCHYKHSFMYCGSTSHRASDCKVISKNDLSK